jgi:hypothetical protein
LGFLAVLLLLALLFGGVSLLPVSSIVIGAIGLAYFGGKALAALSSDDSGDGRL